MNFQTGSASWRADQARQFESRRMMRFVCSGGGRSRRAEDGAGLELVLDLLTMVSAVAAGTTAAPTEMVSSGKTC